MCVCGVMNCFQTVFARVSLKTSLPARGQECGSRVREGDCCEEGPQGGCQDLVQRGLSSVIVTAATGFPERAAWSQPRGPGGPHPARSGPADLSVQLSSRTLSRPLLPGVLCEATASLLQNDGAYTLEGLA